MASEAQIKITLIKSPIGYTQRQKDTVAGLGLKRLRHTVIQPANLQILGMVRKVAHLVQVEEVTPESQPA